MWLDKDFKLAMIKRINKLRNAVHRQNKNLTEIKKFETRNFATENKTSKSSNLKLTSIRPEKTQPEKTERPRKSLAVLIGSFLYMKLVFKD